MVSTTLIWCGFILLILTLLALDLFVFQKEAHEVKPAEAIKWTCVWIAIALCFNVVIYFVYDAGWFPGGGIEHLNGRQAAVRFLTGYLIEKMLSLDNIFVISALITTFRVPKEAEHRVLYWGILGALVMRGLMIVVGTVAIARFHWLIYPLAALLVITGIKLLIPEKAGHEQPSENIAVRLVRRVMPVVRDPNPQAFFTKQNGRTVVTPLFLALVAIETSDVLFALDSVPAVLAVTLDPFIVFTSNVFAILGLRSLYFVLGSLLTRFTFLKQTLSLILVFVGVKMAAAHHFPIDPLLSLGIILAAMLAGVGFSLWIGPPKTSVN